MIDDKDFVKKGNVPPAPPKKPTDTEQKPNDGDLGYSPPPPPRKPPPPPKKDK